MDTTLEDAVEEYGEDMVLNLDDNPNTNFLVYSEDTIRVEEDSQKNIITDNGDGTIDREVGFYLRINNYRPIEKIQRVCF